MIKVRHTYLLVLGLLFVLSGCNTYKSFYKKTHYSITENSKPEKIYRLDLSRQNLSALPKEVQELSNLRMLNISNNPNLDLEEVFKTITENKELSILIMDSMDIDRLPESLRKLTNLSQLSLVNNPDLDWKQSFSVLSTLPLDFLNLKQNNIKTLPDNIVDLKLIKDLNLSYNHLEGTQNFEFLAKLPKLYSLWLDHNEIKELPETIGKLDQVRFLYIDHNELSQLPATMKDMRKVWVIHGGYNKFEELPPVFTEIPGLFMVHMNNNQISIIPEVYSTEKYPLAGLLLDNNPISGMEKEKAQELFKGFFLLSFEQK